MGRLASATNYESLALKFSPTGVQQWARRYSFDQRGDIADSADLDNAGNLLVSGTSTGFNGGSMQDTFTIEYSPTGAVLWTAPIQQNFNTQTDQLGFNGRPRRQRLRSRHRLP